ncbi:MAG: RNA 2',3'-cyclic phosphodiesterase [Pseudomonadales bacterium]|nr:RNA 2',3'-cyclic phosphodiesterase [Pseudomonadales bacterium]
METRAARLFFGIRPDESALASLIDAQRRLQDYPWQGDVRWTPPGSNHLTLRFLGETPRRLIPEMTAFVSDRLEFPCGTFDVTGLMLFPNPKRPTVIAATIAENRLLEDLAKRLDNFMAHFGYKPEKRKFRPHITLGRCGKRFPRGVEIDASVNVTVQYREVILFESITRPEGAQYQDISRFPGS